jgi:putative endonuclease
MFLRIINNIRWFFVTKKNLNGKTAELLAITYLKKNGFVVLQHNFKTKVGEIDIIAVKQKLLIAFEVKYRSDSNILEYAISLNQQYRIKRALEYFLKYNPKFNKYNLRIDAILINKIGNIKIINNAW